MLTELRIKNFAIIETLALPLAPGFNVLSGETGAGKSIIVGALGMLLGERANADMIRTGTDRATVEGTFDVTNDGPLASLLDDRGIEVEDGLVVLKREVATSGRGRAWINGTSVTAAALAEVGRLLVNLHGQHEAQTLLDPESQRLILDAFSGATDQAATVRVAFDELAMIRRTITDLAKRRGDAEQRADYLRHVTREIEEAKVVAGEDDRLEDEARRLEHADELRSLTEAISNAIDGDENAALDQLTAIDRSLTAIQRIDATLDRLRELHDSAYYAIEELVGQDHRLSSGHRSRSVPPRGGPHPPRSSLYADQEVRANVGRRHRDRRAGARRAGPRRIRRFGPGRAREAASRGREAVAG